MTATAVTIKDNDNNMRTFDELTDVNIFIYLLLSMRAVRAFFFQPQALGPNW